MLFIIVSCFVLFSNSFAFDVLPVELCKLEDSACMVQAFQKAVPTFMAGLPEQGVEVLDIMEMDDVKFDLAGFQFAMRQGRLKGMKNAIIDNVKWSMKNKKIEVDFRVNNVIKGLYTAGGRLLILPITGEGQVTMKLKNVAVHFVMDFEVEKDTEGKNHVVPKKYSFDFEVKDNAQFTLTNLFNGNKELSQTMHTFMNENWKQISAEFGKPIMGSIAATIYKNIIKFFQSVPIDDITKQ